MKITYAKAEQTTLFHELSPGDVFSVCLGGAPFMKLRVCSKEDNNAVNLITNATCKFKENAPTVPIDCELIIK